MVKVQLGIHMATPLKWQGDRKEIQKEEGAKPDKVKAPSATPTPQIGGGGESPGQWGHFCYWAPPSCADQRPLLLREHLGQYGLGDCGSYCRSGLQGWKAGLRQCCSSFLFHFAPGRGRATGGRRLHGGKELPLSPASGRGQGISPRCTHLRISAAGPSPEDQLEGQG